MSRQAMEDLMDRWINQPAFREELKSDPEGAVRRAGWELDDAEWAALRSIDWSLPDEELVSRVSKAV